MPTRKRAAPEAVRLLPVPGAYIIGEPAAEREVTPQEAKRLLAFYPPAYRLAPVVKEVITEAVEPLHEPTTVPTTEVVAEPQE